MTSQLAFICDRIQKITEAVYRVTELLPDKEPMKWELREKSVAIFSVIISLKNINLLEKNKNLEKAENFIEQMAAMLSLFSGMKTISGANFEILKEEYLSVQKLICKQKEEEGIVKLDTGLVLPSLAPVVKKAEDKSIGQSNGQNNHIGHNNRKAKILEIIQQKKEVSIGELSALFADCSEKTIQRDLMEMVGRGMLKKEGDKRWRKYKLPSF